METGTLVMLLIGCAMMWGGLVIFVCIAMTKRNRER